MDKIAVLIPCYNEEKTIEKVIRDAKAALPDAVFMFITTIRRTARWRLRRKQARWCEMNISRAKAM